MVGRQPQRAQATILPRSGAGIRTPSRSARNLGVLAVALACFAQAPASAETVPCRAVGHDSRIDLTWNPVAPADVKGYNLYRADQEVGPFEKLNAHPLRTPAYSDFLGRNDQHCWYKVAPIARDDSETTPLSIVDARSRSMNDEELLTSVQEATFRYFWDYGHPVSGLARERSSDDGSVCCTGGTGFGLMAIMVGAQRGFVSRDLAAQRVAKILTFLQDKVDRYHGAFPHWINGTSGKTQPFSKYDDGGDIVETSFLVQGLMAMRQYFDQDDAVELDIRTRATQLWQDVEWDWYLQTPESHCLYWHWSPVHGWKINLQVGGGFNETMVTYLLAMASPTHPIPSQCYDTGWVGSEGAYKNGSDFYGLTQWVGGNKGGPLFFTQYSFIGLDPRGLRDRFCDYFENNRNISLINRSYCMENPSKHAGYDQLVWGLTASSGPDGYAVHSPSHDDGTISPTAAISAMPYTPQESLATLKHLYHTFGKQLWGYFGFKDAFNLDRGWFSNSYLAIDQGPIICMIENYRSGLCWKMFMRNAEIGRAIKSIGPVAAVAVTTVGDHARPPAVSAVDPGSVPGSALAPGPHFENVPTLLKAATAGH